MDSEDPKSSQEHVMGEASVTHQLFERSCYL